jgi:hypothetical protein
MWLGTLRASLSLSLSSSCASRETFESVDGGRAASESGGSLLGDRREEIDEIAVRVAEQDRAVSPRHRGRLLHPTLHMRSQAGEFGVDVVYSELKDDAAVRGWLCGVATERARCLAGAATWCRRGSQTRSGGRLEKIRLSGVVVVVVSGLVLETVGVGSRCHEIVDGVRKAVGAPTAAAAPIVWVRVRWVRSRLVPGRAPAGKCQRG